MILVSRELRALRRLVLETGFRICVAQVFPAWQQPQDQEKMIAGSHDEVSLDGEVDYLFL